MNVFKGKDNNDMMQCVTCNNFFLFAQIQEKKNSLNVLKAKGIPNTILVGWDKMKPKFILPILVPSLIHHWNYNLLLWVQCFSFLKNYCKSIYRLKALG